MRLQNMCG